MKHSLYSFNDENTTFSRQCSAWKSPFLSFIHKHNKNRTWLIISCIERDLKKKLFRVHFGRGEQKKWRQISIRWCHMQKIADTGKLLMKFSLILVYWFGLCLGCYCCCYLHRHNFQFIHNPPLFLCSVCCVFFHGKCMEFFATDLILTGDDIYPSAYYHYRWPFHG